MAFQPGSQPFGKLVRFGNIDFSGPSWPINTNIQWKVNPASLVDAAYPADPMALKVNTMEPMKAKFQYGIIADCSVAHTAAPLTYNSSIGQLESQCATIYKGLRSHNNQSASLIVNTSDSTHDFAYCRARIESFVMHLTPGSVNNAIMIDLIFVLLSEWKDHDPTTQFPLTYNPDGTNPIGDIRVPFGNLVSFGNEQQGTIQIDDMSNLPKFGRTSIVNDYTVEWLTSFSSIPHSIFPLDHWGVSPCPMKPIEATWEISFTGINYSDVFSAYNLFLTQLRSKPQHGLLVCTDSAGVPRTAPARIVKYPLDLTPFNKTVYHGKITFLILGDWYAPS